MEMARRGWIFDFAGLLRLLMRTLHFLMAFRGSNPWFHPSGLVLRLFCGSPSHVQPARLSIFFSEQPSLDWGIASVLLV